MNGEEVYKWGDSHTFDGECKNNKMHGKGCSC